MEGETPRRDLLISKGWVQASALVIILGFFVLGLLAYRTYSADPPIPERVVDPAGSTLFTGDDISEGQQIFLRNGLMEYGSIFGHGAYLGPDFTADYLHRAALVVGGRLRWRRLRPGARADDRRLPGQPLRLRERRPSHTARAQARAFNELTAHYHELLLEPDHRDRPAPERDRESASETRQLTAFFSWSAWAAAARRPGHNYSYTNNWPPEKLVDNGPTANVLGLERALADRPARRHRRAVRGVRALELPRLAWA